MHLWVCSVDGVCQWICSVSHPRNWLAAILFFCTSRLFVFISFLGLVKPRLGLQMGMSRQRCGGDSSALLRYIGWYDPYNSDSPAATMPADLNHANARCTWEADWDLQGTFQYICAGGFQRVALQFPDELLKDAVLVTRDLQRLCIEQSSGCQVHTHS